MAKTIHINFSEKDGKIVVNFSGVPTHEEEHELLNELLLRLRQQGLETEVVMAHRENPKLPDVGLEGRRDPGRQGGGA